MLGIKMKTDSRAFVNYLRTKGLLTVAAGDRIKWGETFGKVERVVHAIRDGERREREDRIDRNEDAPETALSLRSCGKLSGCFVGHSAILLMLYEP